ncbi:MAG: DUF1566 domain-containing protein [Nitrospirota bacterium]|nr:DUF1566 domain-containing protein [Nitrospirota bacterium]
MNELNLRYAAYQVRYAIILLSLFMFSCGGGGGAVPGPQDPGSQYPVPTGYGSIDYQILWPGNTSTPPSRVATLRMIIFSPEMATMQQDLPSTSDQGSISSIPQGSDRTLTVRGLDSAGVVLYEGASGAFTITDGQTTTVPPVTMVAVGANSPTSPNAPTAPTGVSATPADSQNAIEWSPSAGATSYNIYWSKLPGVTKWNGAKISGTTSPHIHTGLWNGQIYYYVVTAVNAEGESADSSEVNSTPLVNVPGVPSGVSATPGNGQTTITWTAVPGATWYNIYWSESSGLTKANGTKISITTSPYSPYIHTGRTNGKTYYYIVTAANNSGESAGSSIVSATPQIAALGVPTGLSATPGDGRITINWSSLTGATSYNIYWSLSSVVTKTTGTKISGVTSSYTHTGLANGTTYYYVLTALNAGGESAESIAASAQTRAGITGKIPDTGQTICSDSSGTLIACPLTDNPLAQDGSYTIDAPSFTDNVDGTITDSVTGLMWQKTDDGTTLNWTSANSYCEGLVLPVGGYSDWRLPSRMELLTIVDYGKKSPAIDMTFFTKTAGVWGHYWSNTSSIFYLNEYYVWYVDFSNGSTSHDKKTGLGAVRCVR